MVLWQQILFHFGADDLMILLLNFLVKSASFNIVVFPLGRRDPVLELQFAQPCVILLCFATQSRQIEWNGCVKVRCCGCVRNIFVFPS